MKGVAEVHAFDTMRGKFEFAAEFGEGRAVGVEGNPAGAAESSEGLELRRGAGVN